MTSDIEDLKQKREFLDTFVGTPALNNYVDALLQAIESLQSELSAVKAERDDYNKRLHEMIERDSLRRPWDYD